MVHTVACRVRVDRTIYFINDKTGRSVICKRILLDATDLDNDFIKGTIRRHRASVGMEWNGME